MTFVCMAVPSRKAIVGYLQRHVAGLVVCMDERRDANGNFKRCLSSAGNGPMVFLEDDIVITRDFVAKVKAAIDKQPAALIQMHSRTSDDLTKGSRWRSAKTFINTQCVYFPPGMAADLLAYSETPEVVAYLKAGIAPYDTMIGNYLSERGVGRYWNHCPTLAEHLPIRSLIDKRRSRSRQSTTFADPEWNGHPLAEKLVGWIK